MNAIQVKDWAVLIRRRQHAQWLEAQLLPPDLLGILAGLIASW